MHVGQRIRITQNYVFEDFVVVKISAHDVQAAAVLDPQRLIQLALVNGELALPNVPDAEIYVVYALTGILNIDVLILAKTDETSLNMLSKLSPDLSILTQRDELWLTKVELEFGEAVAAEYRYKPPNISARDFYSKINMAYAIIKRANVNATLDAAVNTNNLTGVRIALHAGANVDHTSRGADSTLMWASAAGHLEIVKELLQHGANVNHIGSAGGTALIRASQKHRLAVVKELLQRGANVNAANNSGDTALIWAVSNKDLDLVKELLRAHADVNARNNAGQTALSIADNRHITDIVDVLRQHGAT